MAEPAQTDLTVVIDMEELLSLQAEPPLRLRQLSGPGEGRNFRVLPLQEAAIGRDELCEIQLDEKTVSRRHTKISYLAKSPEVIDLDSSNGTFVNGQQVERASLHDGDSLQVGSCSFRVGLGQDSTSSADVPRLSEQESKRIRQALESSRGPVKVIRHRSVFSGELREINLMSLLQIVAANRSTGSLAIQYPAEKGSIYLAEGELNHARLGHVIGPKALYRMAALPEGSFEFFTPGREPEQRSISDRLEKHLLEAARQMDELATYRAQLPDASVRLTFRDKLIVDLTQMPPPVLEVLGAISRAPALREVMESCPLPDLEIARILLMLLQKGVVVPRTLGPPDTAVLKSYNTPKTERPM